MAATAEAFHWADYVVFGCILALSCGIGLYYALSGGKQKTQDEFLMADRKMHTLPVATSMLVSFVSAILILGAPAEIYTYGTQFWMYTFGIGLAAIFSALLFVPLLYPLKLTSSYEYLELRFNSKAAKIVGSLILITSQVIYMGIATYSPSTALEAVTGFPVWASILCVGLVSTFYTALGGMKAVIWTDVLQSVIMIGGVLAVIIVGCIELGGIVEIWVINEKGGRVEFFDFDPDPTKRQSFWSLIIGGAVYWLASYGVSQASVQRFCALPTMGKARMAFILNIGGMFLLMTLCCLSGMVVYAYFAECDPLTHPNPAHRLGNANQLIPYFVMQVLGWPGIPGLFVATIFSGALSSVSSSLNAIVAVVWEDMLKWKFDYVSETKKVMIMKGSVVLFGGACIAMAFAAQKMGGTVLQAAISFTSAASTPLLGLFLLGGLFPWSNWLGAVIGGLVGLAFGMWLSIGSYIVEHSNPTLNTTTVGCFWNNTWGEEAMAENIIEPAIKTLELEGIQKLYTVSYLWFPAIGTGTTVIVGLLVSLIAAPFLDTQKASEVDRRYLIPIFDWLFCCLPNKWRESCRSGTENEENKDQEESLTAEFDKSNIINGCHVDTVMAVNIIDHNTKL